MSDRLPTTLNSFYAYFLCFIWNQHRRIGNYENVRKIIAKIKREIVISITRYIMYRVIASGQCLLGINMNIIYCRICLFNEWTQFSYNIILRFMMISYFALFVCSSNMHFVLIYCIRFSVWLSILLLLCFNILSRWLTNPHNNKKMLFISFDWPEPEWLAYQTNTNQTII